MMHCSTWKATILAALVPLITPIGAVDYGALDYHGYYFVQGVGRPITIQRLDPVMAAGSSASNHVHAVIGGGAFKSSMTHADTQTSKCSNIQIQQDLSNYWVPSLYFQDPKDGTFTRVPEKPEFKLYYKYGTGGNKFDSDITEFPEEFRMITGDAMLRAPGDIHDDKHMGLHWYCHAKSGSYKTVGFPSGFTECDGYGLYLELRFPSCANGNAFDPANPTAHMAYPTGDGKAGCPSTHQHARYPTIFMEVGYETTSFNGKYSASQMPWVLASGDATGYGAHADFLNGWKTGALNAAMPNCNVGESGDPLSKCFGQLRTDLECTVPQVTAEDVGVLMPYNDKMGGTLKALPGCNPVTKGPERASIRTDCANVDYGTTTGGTSGANNTSGSMPSQASSVVAAAPSSASASSSDAPMGYMPASSVSASVMSASTASPSSTSTMADSASTMAASASTTSDSASTMAVSASTMEVPASTTSDSTSTMSVPASATSVSAPASSDVNVTNPVTTAPSSGGYGSSSPPSSGNSGSCDKSNFGGSWKYLGCFADNNDRVMKGIHLAYLGYQNVTSTGCAAYCDGRGFHYSGTEAGGQCFCSHEAPKKTSDNCNVCCEGAAGKTEVCGGGWALSVYAKPGSTKRAHRHRRGAHQFAKLS